MIRPTLALVAVCALAALTATGTASAASPTLLTVGESGGYATATWSLAPGAQAWTIEVATSPALDPADGSFVSDDVADIHVFMDTSTSWTGTVSLDPGTYYVHISGSSCASCGDVTWSPVKSFAVAGSTTTSAQTTTVTTTTTASPTTTSTTATTTTTPAATSPTTTSSTTPTPVPTTPTPTSTTPAQPDLATPSYGARRPAIEHAALGLVAGRVEGTLRVCSREPARLVVRTLARRGGARLAAHAHLAAAASGCWPYLVRFGVPRGSGPVTVTLRVGDGAGAWSRPLSRRLGSSS